MTESEYWYNRASQDRIYGDMQHEAAMTALQKHYGFWQVCPMCNGFKFIPGSHFNTDGSITVNPTCHICNGEGILVRPEITDKNEKL